MTELHQAAQQGDAAKATALLKGGADPDQTMEFDWTALHLAVTAGSAPVVAALLAGGADLQAQNEDGLTPLHLAASKGSTAMVNTLLQAGADPAVRTRNGSCAHDTAAGHGHADAARALPQTYEADVDFDNASSPYYYAKPTWDLNNLKAGPSTQEVVLTVPVKQHLSFKADPKAAKAAGEFGAWYASRCDMSGSKQGSQKGEGKKEEKKEAKKAEPKKKEEKKKKGKEEKAADPEAEKKAQAKKLKASEKEGGKKGVEIEGAADMGGLAFFCSTLMEPDGDMAMTEAAFVAMNAPIDEEAEERRGGAGHLGKMMFSAGPEFLQIVCNVPADLQVEKDVNGMMRKGMNAKTWVEYVLAKFAKESPGLKVAEGSDVNFAKASVPKNQDIGFFPLKIKDDAMSAAYELLRNNNCIQLNDSSDEGVCHGDFVDDY